MWDVRCALATCIAGRSPESIRRRSESVALIVMPGTRLASRAFPTGTTALVIPADPSLYPTPDMESRVVFRANEAKLLTSKDYSSPRGTEGYYVVRAVWSPDSQFFVYSMSSSGGHSPWSFPTWVYSRQNNLIYSFTDLIGDKPTLSEEFSFSGPHTVKASTWEKAGSEKSVPVVIDLEDAIKKAAPPSEK